MRALAERVLGSPRAISVLLGLLACGLTPSDARACQPGDPSKARPTDPPRAVLLADADLPRNAHLFVAVSFATALPPLTSFELRAGTRTLAFEDRWTATREGRLHELVPTEELDPSQTYELRWSGQTQPGDKGAATFRFTVRDVRDLQPPVWSATDATTEVRVGPKDGCGSDRPRTVIQTGAPIDDVSGGFVLLLHRDEFGDDLLDLDAPPSVAFVTPVGAKLSVAEGGDRWIGVELIDLAGHRLPVRELAVGQQPESPRVRALRRTTRKIGAFLAEHPWPCGLGLLVVIAVAIGALRRRAATAAASG